MECKYCDDYTGICTNDQCPMCADACPVPDVKGVCQFEERQETAYVLTAQGLCIGCSDGCEADQEQLRSGGECILGQLLPSDGEIRLCGNGDARMSNVRKYGFCKPIKKDPPVKRRPGKQVPFGKKKKRTG